MQRRTFLQSSAGVVGFGLATASVSGESTSGDTEEPFEPLGTASVPGAADAAVQGDYVYVAATDGFAVVNLEQPDSPEVVAERRDIETGTDDPFRDIKDVWPWEDRLVVGGPANSNPSNAHGFALFDISEPQDPERITFYETGVPVRGGHYVHNTYFEDGIVYLTGTGHPDEPLVMIDVTDDEPEEVGRWSIVTEYDSAYGDVLPFLRTLHDVYVQDETAYLPCWDAGTFIVDVSDPSNPETLSRINHFEVEELAELEGPQASLEARTPPGNAHYAQVDEDGEILAVGEEAWEVETNGETIGGPGGVDLYDVSEKTDPEHLARIDAPEADGQTTSDLFTSAHNLDIVDDRLYTSWYYGGVRLFDIDDPSDPELLAWWRQPEEASFWTAQAADGSFVAPSVDLSRGFDEALPTTREALYVFPDRAGEQPDSPSLSDGTRNGSDQNDGTSDGTGGSNGTSDETDDEGAGDETDEEGDADGADSFGPGFGVVSALAGTAGGYYLHHLRSGDE